MSSPSMSLSSVLKPTPHKNRFPTPIPGNIGSDNVKLSTLPERASTGMELGCRLYFSSNCWSLDLVSAGMLLLLLPSSGRKAELLCAGGSRIKSSSMNSNSATVPALLSLSTSAVVCCARSWSRMTAARRRVILFV